LPVVLLQGFLCVPFALEDDGVRVRVRVRVRL
jgi:hypothetical protein